MEGLTEKLAFEQRLGKVEGVGCVGKCFEGFRNGQDKAFEVGHVLGIARRPSRVMGAELWGGSRGHMTQGCGGLHSTQAFPPGSREPWESLQWMTDD